MKSDKRVYGDRRQYLIRAVHARRKKIRHMAIEYKGGKCQVCGYDRCSDALEFHHNNLIEKQFGISAKGYTRSWKDVVKELDKCKLICANCHRELHARLAASAGNDGVKKRVNSGKAIESMVNPEPSLKCFGEGAETRDSLPKAYPGHGNGIVRLSE